MCRRHRVQGGGLGPNRSPCCSSSSSLVSPYEEVVRYQRHPEDRHRLIALLGESGCARGCTCSRIYIYIGIGFRYRPISL